MSINTEEFKELLNALAVVCPQLPTMIRTKQITGTSAINQISRLVISYQKFSRVEKAWVNTIISTNTQFSETLPPPISETLLCRTTAWGQGEH